MRFQVDPFVWSADAPRWLRRRYTLDSACFALGMLSMALLFQTDGIRHEDSRPGSLAFGAIGVLVAARLAWKLRRHGW